MAVKHEYEAAQVMSPQRLCERLKSRLTPAEMAQRCSWFQKLDPFEQSQCRLWLESWVLPDLDWAVVKLTRRKKAKNA